MASFDDLLRHLINRNELNNEGDAEANPIMARTNNLDVAGLHQLIQTAVQGVQPSGKAPPVDASKT